MAPATATAVATAAPVAETLYKIQGDHPLFGWVDIPEEKHWDEPVSPDIEAAVFKTRAEAQGLLDRLAAVNEVPEDRRAEFFRVVEFPSVEAIPSAA